MNSQLSDINPEQLLELERFAEIGRLSAGLLHEISNPLAAAMLWLEQYENRHSPHIHHVWHSIRQLQRYVEAARQQIRRESPCQNFCVQTEIEQVKQILEPIAKHHGVKLRFGSAKGYMLRGDPVKFQQIIANLISNAIDSYAVQSEHDSRLVCLDFSDRQGFLIIEVRDRGCGITDSQLSRIFQPFYSTKSDVGLGLGIGLFAIKRHIETDFQGDIKVENSRHQGTKFIVRLRMAPLTD